MGMYTNVEVKAWLEKGINVYPTPNGDPLLLLPDGRLINKQDQLVDGADAVRAQLYDKYSGRMAPIGAKLFYLGAPAVSDNDALVSSTNMINGEYTLQTDADPDVPRNILVTATAGDTADTMGTITVYGTDIADRPISEVIVPATTGAVAGKLAFKTVEKVVGAGWAKDETEETNDTIKIGYGNKIGLPIQINATSDVLFGILGSAIAAATGGLSTPGTLAGSTADMSASTYDGTKKMYVFVLC